MRRTLSTGVSGGLVLAALISACGGQQHRSTQDPVKYSTMTGPHGTEVARTVFPYSPIPRGWKTYRGMGVPFAVAYPAHWLVDESGAPVGKISFMDNPKTGSIAGDVTTRGLPSQRAQLTVLRSRFLSEVTRVCEAGKKVGKTGRARVSRATFLTVTATCAGEEGDKGKEETGFYLGVGVKDGSEWMFAFRSHSDELAANQRRYFTPMLRTLHVYKRA